MSDPADEDAAEPPDAASRAVLELLGDEYIQAILAAVSQEPKSAKALSTELDISRSTVYRRAERLLDHDLLVERTHIEHDGSHHSVFEANIDHIEIGLDAGEFSVRLEPRDTAADRFTKLWEDIREV